MAGLHVAGFFRALGSAFDCLGAAMIGVLALPSEIIKADLKKARRSLSGTAQDNASGGGQLKREFEEWLDECVNSVGPKNWLDWVLGMRNMYVHRGRRYQLISVKVDAPILGPDELPIPIQHHRLQLPNDPDRSDVEVFLDTKGVPILAEYADVSIDGAFRSAADLAKQVSSRLLRCWERRRKEPDLLTQPKEQWPKDPELRTPFSGFGHAEAPFNPSSMTSNPAWHRRLLAASLDAENRGRWDEFIK
jgi:hypothetical protein